MTTRMSGTSGRWSMWLAVACLMAMTSTLSAQAEKTDGASGPGASVGSAGSVSMGSGSMTLSGQGMAQIQPPYAGTCGTDTTFNKQPPIWVHARIAILLYSRLYLHPGHMAQNLALIGRAIAMDTASSKPL